MCQSANFPVKVTNLISIFRLPLKLKSRIEQQWALVFSNVPSISEHHLTPWLIDFQSFPITAAQISKALVRDNTICPLSVC